jgi:putative glycosyltransferase
MYLSVVTTVFKSEKYIIEFYNRITQTIRSLNIDKYEIIFVNDGSPDNSSEKLKKISLEDKRVKYIELSRNFGHHNAIFAGLDHVSGELIYLIDIDLEDEPEWLNLFLKELNKKNLDVVYGKQKKRSGSMFRKISGDIWYKILNYLTDSNHDRNITTARLMTREYVLALRNFQEKNTIISGIFHLAGFQQKGVFIDKTFRDETTYTLSKKLDIVFKTLVSLSNKPLRIVIFSNLIFSFFSLLFTCSVFFIKLFSEKNIPGWSSIAIILSGSYTLLSITLAVLGLYIEQIYNEIKNRPRYLIRRKDG